MKKGLRFLKVTILTIALLTTIGVKAQECNATLFLKKGTILEYTNYDKKGRDQGSAKHETLSMNDDNGKLSAEIQVTMDGKKKGETFTTQYNAYCENGLISIDMSRFFDNSKLMQYDENDFTIDVDGNVLQFPVNMSEGDQLNNGEITIKVSNETMTLVTMVMNVTDRKVLANENITTPAGTFECQKVSFKFETKFGIIKVRGSATEWYHKDKVLVKSESYNKKGKLVGYTLLTKLSK